MIDNLIIVLIVALIVGGIAAYLLRAKKRGQHCIGCPYAGKCQKCSGKCSTQNIQE